MSVADLTSIALLGLAIAFLARICWTDFFYLKIWNRDLTTLLAITLLFLVVSWPADLLLRLAFSAIIFALGLVFWLLHALGAGDVKLFGIVGALIGSTDALIFVGLILLFALAMVAVFRKVEYLRLIPHLAGSRVVELASTGRMPYGVPISLATIALVLPKIYGGF